MSTGGSALYETGVRVPVCAVSTQTASDANTISITHSSFEIATMSNIMSAILGHLLSTYSHLDTKDDYTGPTHDKLTIGGERKDMRCPVLPVLLITPQSYHASNRSQERADTTNIFDHARL